MGYWVVVCVLVSRSVRVGLLVVVLACGGVWVLVSSGGRGCLGVGCVVVGGVLLVWLRGGVVRGGVSVGFGVGGRVFVLSGVGVPVSCVVASGSGSGVGGVRVCVLCARVVFGGSWCSLVLRRWARAAGVGGAEVDGLLGSGDGGGSAVSLCSPALVVASLPGFACVSGSVSSLLLSARSLANVGGRVGAEVDGLLGSGDGGGSAVSLCSPALVVASLPGFACVSGSVSSLLLSARSLANVGGRVGVGFGVRVGGWGARVGVGGGVVSGGGVVAGWWARACGRVRGLVSGVGAKGVGVGWLGWCGGVGECVRVGGVGRRVL